MTRLPLEFQTRKIDREATFRKLATVLFLALTVTPFLFALIPDRDRAEQCALIGKRIQERPISTMASVRAWYRKHCLEGV